MDLGLYIHIPFCRKKCDYCSFYSVPLPDYPYPAGKEYLNKYIETLLTELKSRSSELKDFTVDTIYFGGGTPSLLDPFQLEKIINSVNSLFRLHKNPEITVEFNPDDFSADKINSFVSQGVNRIVMGVQSMNERLHSVIGRTAGVINEKLLSDFASIKSITHCIDMIVGIPGQTESGLLNELKKIVQYKFEHISAYTLSIGQNTPLYKRCKPVPALNDMQRVMLEKSIDFFTAEGYKHYEVSNYALPLHESKHNLKYWKFLPYAGFGPGAHSFYYGERYFNPDSVDYYIKNEGRMLQKDERTKNSEIVEFILSGLRLTDGISVKDFESKLNIEMPDELFEKFSELKNKEFLYINELKNDTIVRFTRNGFFQMDGLIYEIVERYL
jgi:oxygen-independent coproporphyrinogen III oxidase